VAAISKPGFCVAPQAGRPPATIQHQGPALLKRGCDGCDVMVVDAHVPPLPALTRTSPTLDTWKGGLESAEEAATIREGRRRYHLDQIYVHFHAIWAKKYPGAVAARPPSGTFRMSQGRRPTPHQPGSKPAKNPPLSPRVVTCYLLAWNQGRGGVRGCYWSGQVPTHQFRNFNSPQF
jgi:hypothetical protein